MKSNRILLKATEFYRISLNSLQILLQISLWMSFVDFTANFITDFTAVFIMDFTAYFMLNSPDLITNFMDIFITSTMISLKSTVFHYGFQCGFNSSVRSTDFMHEIWQISWNQQNLTQLHKIQHNFTKTNRIYWNPQHFTGFHWNQ